MNNAVYDILNGMEDAGMIGSGAMDFIADLIIAAESAYVMLILVGLLAMIVPFFYYGYMYFCVGRKAGISSDKSWMAFLPIAREIYQCNIIRMPVWYIVFLEGTVNSVISFLIFMVFGVALKIPVLAVILVAAFVIASWIFRFFYYSKFYKKFGFNSNTAFIEILKNIPPFGFIKAGLFAFIAFANSVAYGGKAVASSGAVSAPERVMPNDNGGTQMRKAFITGVSGKYAGATFEISDGQPIVFGRSAEVAHIIFDQFETDISRKHCSVRYDALSGQYILVDESTNGTFDGNGNRYPQKQQINIAPGTVIYLGKSRKNAFRIG